MVRGNKSYGTGDQHVDYHQHYNRRRTNRPTSRASTADGGSLAAGNHRKLVVNGLDTQKQCILSRYVLCGDRSTSSERVPNLRFGTEWQDHVCEWFCERQYHPRRSGLVRRLRGRWYRTRTQLLKYTHLRSASQLHSGSLLGRLRNLWKQPSASPHLCTRRWVVVAPLLTHTIYESCWWNPLWS